MPRGIKENQLSSTTNARQPTRFLHPSAEQLASLRTKLLSNQSLPLTCASVHHRSKLLISTVGVNPLITSAAALLDLISQLRFCTAQEQLELLFNQVQQEIKAFESQALLNGYVPDTVLLARYLICTVLDEVVLGSEWAKKSHYYQSKFLVYFHKEEWGGERFFEIVDYIKLDPHFYIDIIELAYLCINLGFQGKYQFLDKGYLDLEKISYQLYQFIMLERGIIKKSIEIAVKIPQIKMPLISAKLFLTLTGISAFSIYTIFNFVLGLQAIPFYKILF